MQSLKGMIVSHQKLHTLSILALLLVPATMVIDSDIQNNYVTDSSDSSPTIPFLDNLEAPEIYDASALIDMNAVNYTVTNTADSFEGYTLYSFHQFNRFTGDYKNSLNIMGMNGTIIAEIDLGDTVNSNCPAQFIDPDTVLVGTEEGAKLWHISTDTLESLNIISHHEYEYNPNADTIFGFERYVRIFNESMYEFDYIQEYALNGTLVWSLDTYDFINESMWCPYHDMRGARIDITHSNTIFYDPREDIIYYNSRNVNTFYKINHTSSEVMWGLGEYGNFTLYDIHGDLQDNLFYHPHSIEKVDDKTFILFDNDYHNQTDEFNMQSRMLEIVIDESTMTANESWYYTAPADYFSTGFGDADRLPNGNRIGCFGYPTTPSSGLSAAFVEVNEQGKVVWETRFYYDNNYLYGSYRLERFRFSPIISPAPDIFTANSEPTIRWNVFYNYRNKAEVPGDYRLFIDDIEVESGNFTYSQFWRPTQLSLTPDSLNYGYHNVTLEISDGFGHYTSDTVNVTIKTFFVHYSGPTTIEKGQPSSLPTWSGVTFDKILCNITLNDTLYSEFNWIGEDIVLYPATIEAGTYLVQLRMFNETIEIFSDAHWITVAPPEAPVIIPQQASLLTIGWGDSLNLSWDLTDICGQTWALYLDGVKVAEGSWFPPLYHLNWTLPSLFDGLHNITVAATDMLGLSAADQTVLVVFPPINPQILSSPGNTTVEWGTENVTFHWDVYRATSWVLDKNDELIGSGDVVGNSIDFTIISWHEQDWRLGTQQLRLTVYFETLKTTDTITVEVIADSGDPFVDELISSRSEWYILGNSTIGAPDGLFSIIFVDYSNGYVTLDMGENEEIIDESGYDFEVFASGDNYSVYIGNSLEESLVFLGLGHGNSSFDIASTGMSVVRYIRIEVYSGVSVSIDAVVAIHYNVPPSDRDAPVIVSLDDTEMWLSDVNTTLIWIATDDTPWSYEIMINGTAALSDWWYGDQIEYTFTPESTGIWNVTIVVYDAFGNFISDIVLVSVNEYTDQSSPYPVIFITSIGIAIAIVILLLFRKKILMTR